MGIKVKFLGDQKAPERSEQTMRGRPDGTSWHEDWDSPQNPDTGNSGAVDVHPGL